MIMPERQANDPTEYLRCSIALVGTLAGSGRDRLIGIASEEDSVEPLIGCDQGIMHVTSYHDRLRYEAVYCLSL